MGKIHRLSEKVVQQIAAGEIIERPASVLKELVENALDAEATRIEAEVEEGGLRRICVTDNGWGLDAEDLALCVEPHATSKIQSLEDLRQARTLGFRGEALAAMATFADLKIISRAVGALTGYELRVTSGRKTLQETSASVGTKVIAEHLFSRHPARRKQCSSPSREKALMIKTIQLQSMAFPSVYFSLKENGRMLYQSAPLVPLEERLPVLFGEKKIFFPVKISRPFQIEGYCSDTTLSYPDARHLYFLVNGRWVRSPLLIKAVRRAYADTIPQKSYPAGVFLLKIPPEKLDVNIHPRKEEVAFLEEKELFRAVYDTLSRTLQREKAKTFAVAYPFPAARSDPLRTAEPMVSYQAVPQELEGFSKESYTILGQLWRTFILVEDANGLIIVDQHALHERFLLEQWKQKRQKPYQCAELLFPLTVTLPSEGIAFFEAHRQLLEEIGFQATMVSANAVAVRSAPQVKGLMSESALRAFFMQLAEEAERKSPYALEEEAIKLLSCKNAVRAGDRLDKQEMEKLISAFDDLSCLSPSLFSCAHGRPTVRRIEKQELYKMFHRR